MPKFKMIKHKSNISEKLNELGITKNSLSKTKYEYKCNCGAICILETDTKPKKLQKCFKCQNEIGGYGK